jgi:predicted transcriptional regulator
MKTITGRVEDLVERGLVEDKGRGVYRLTDRGTDVAERLAELDDLT